MTSFNINKATHKDAQKQEKIRKMTNSPNENEAKVAEKKLRPSAAISLPLKNEYEPSLVQKILGEEGCGCDEPKCNNTPSGKKCPMHGKKDCSVKEESVTIEDMFGNKFVEFIDLIKPEDVVGNQMKSLNTENHIAVAMGKEIDDEGGMIMSQLNQIEMAVERLRKVVKDPKMQLPGWVQSKITMATDYIDTASDYMNSKNEAANPAQQAAIAINMKKKGKKPKNMTEAVRLPSEYGNLIAAIVMWRGRTQQLTLFFPQAKMPSKKDVQREVEKIYPGGKVITFGLTDIASNYSAIDAPIVRVGYHGGNLGKPGPSKNYVKPMGEEVEVDEDWQKVNRQDKTDGLSQAAVDAYRRENPNSKLQTAVTEKKPTGKRAKRRSSFCSRMKGMKSKLTSAKTSRDPDSRINKALRRWNCN